MAYEVGPVYFDAPPVAEVALSIQTSPNPRVLTSHMGVFWDRHLRLDYPHAQDQTFAAPTIESFDEGSWMPSMVFAMGTPVGRQWFLSVDQTRLVQLQNDRLVVNWRRLATQAYPHYRVLRDEIARLAQLWQDFLSKEDLAPQPVVQAEVTYINQVPIEASIKRASDVGVLLRAVQPQWPTPMGEPESFQFEQRFVVQAPGDKLARMYLAVAPAMFAGTQGLSLNLVVRGQPADTSNAGVLRWMDFAHNQIVHSFADITTDQMHDKWRERNDHTSAI